MAGNSIARSVAAGRLFGLDAIDWSLIIGGVALVFLLALLP